MLWTGQIIVLWICNILCIALDEVLYSKLYEIGTCNFWKL